MKLKAVGAIVISLLLLAMCFLPALGRRRGTAWHECVYNLLAIYNDYQNAIANNEVKHEHFVSKPSGPLRLGDAASVLSTLSNSNKSYYELVCPQDKRINPAIRSPLKNSNISYFVSSTFNGQSSEYVISGNRHLKPVLVNTNITSWIWDISISSMHNGSGFILFGDGSVRIQSNDAVGRVLSGDQNR